MRDGLVLDLDDCTEFRLALQARPPRIAHGTLLLLVALLGMTLGWSAATRAYLVVRAPGRVRPLVTPLKVFSGGRGEMLSASAGGRVVEVGFRQGDRVLQGALLIRLETRRLENEIAKQRSILRAGDEELAKLDQLEALLARQSAVAWAKAEAELVEARAKVRRDQAQRDVEIRLAQLALRIAELEEAPLRRLMAKQAVAPLELLRAAAKTHEAREQLARSRLPVNEEGVAIHQRALELAGRDDALKRAELELRRAARRSAVEAARIELANLELERKQAVIRAPIDGVVISGDVKIGDLLEPGKPVAEIAQQKGFRFEVSVPSEEVGRLRLGMPARIKLDAYDYQRYGTLDGTVCFIAPDSGQSAGPRTAEYVVRVDLKSDEVRRGRWRGRVKLGMAGRAEIVTGRESLLFLLRKHVRQSITLY